MKLSRLFAAAVLAGALAAGSMAQAKPVTWDIDPSHSGVTFTIRHLFAKVPGSFDKFSGAIVYDVESVGASSTQVEIQATSINTKNERRDTHLRSADFFEVEKYPTITFKSNAVKDLGGSKHELTGDLTMHGVTKPVTLTVTFLGAGPGMGGEQRAGFEATGRINRKDFGILWNKNLDKGGMLLGDDVDFTIGIEAMEQKAEAAGEKK
jgi:polyisoprenoid-binding protein YceI